MRCFFVALALMPMLTLPIAAGSAEDAVRKAETAWAAAAARGDVNALDRLLSSQLLYAHSTGQVENKREYIGKIRSGARKYQAIEHKEMLVKVFGDTAMVHATLRFLGANQATPFDHLVMQLHLWIKQDGRWQLVGHQATQLRK